MKKIVLLTGSPRKNGNSNTMAEAFRKEAESRGAEVTVISATDKKIGGCRACQACYKNGVPCAFEPEYNEIAGEFESADAIVLAFPVYWYNIPSQIKAVIDHWYSFCVAGKDFSGKKTALISCCEEEDPNTLSGVKFAFEKTMELMDAEIVGEVLVPGVNEAGDVAKTDGEQQARELAEKFF